MTQNDTAGQYASYGFDACMMDMYPALSAGAAVCIVPEEMRLDLSAMNEYFIKNGVTVAFMTTQVGRQFAVEMKTPGLRAISVGGEKLASMEPPKGIEFYNGYGPTECTIFSTIYHVTKKEDNIPIGHPLADLKCYVVDAFGHLLPPGALGELIIAGPHVGEGYLNRPEKTEEVFVENPFDIGEYKKAYRSGDIVRYRLDGEIEFIGRRDGQVKIHGFRVELSEVEAVIREIDKIKDVAVVAKDLGADGKAIAAYYVSDEKVEAKEIAEYIRTRKPPYMIPASIMQIDKIPLNQNGKVNKKALPEPVITAMEEDSTHVDNVLETELKSIIGEALNMPNPPLNTALEFLGFTSLSMIRLSTKLLKNFGIDIPVKSMKDLSITDIENRILENWMNNGAAGGVKEPDKEEDSMPLSAAQSGIYVDCMKNPNAITYNIPSIITFDAGMDPERIKDAVGRVLQAHPSVFVHFDIDDKQVVAIKDEISLPEIPVYEKSAEECEAFQKDFVKAFHLNRGPLFKFAIIKGKEDVKLYADFHHLIFDGFSMDRFLKELGKALKSDGKIEKEMSSYFAYIKNQKEMLESERGDEYEEYYANLLGEYESSTELPSDVSKAAEPGKKKFAYGSFDENLVSKACRDLSVSEAGLFLAALDYTLARVSVSDKIYLATISSGRSDVRFADTFGMFVNTLPLAAKLSDGTVNDFVKEVSDGLQKAMDHENYPFAEVAAKWGFDIHVMYEYQRGIVEKPDIPGLVKVEGIETPEAKFGITLYGQGHRRVYQILCHCH